MSDTIIVEGTEHCAVCLLPADDCVCSMCLGCLLPENRCCCGTL